MFFVILRFVISPFKRAWLFIWTFFLKNFCWFMDVFPLGLIQIILVALNKTKICGKKISYKRAERHGLSWQDFKSRKHNLLVDVLLICLTNLHNSDNMICDRNTAISNILYLEDLEGNLLSLEFGERILIWFVYILKLPDSPSPPLSMHFQYIAKDYFHFIFIVIKYHKMVTAAEKNKKAKLRHTGYLMR